MTDHSKYIVVESMLGEYPIIFDPILNHCDVAAGLIVSGHKVISAGFVCLPSTNGGKVLVWGESVSLKLKHSSTDAELISNRILREN